MPPTSIWRRNHWPFAESAKHISDNCHVLRAFRGSVPFPSCGELMGHALVSCHPCSESCLLTGWLLFTGSRLLCVSSRQTIYQGTKPAEFHSYLVTRSYNFPVTPLLIKLSQPQQSALTLLKDAAAHMGFFS